MTGGITNGYKMYLEAVKSVFESEIKYTQLVSQE